MTKERKIKVVGLTGQTGAGKSSVSEILSSQGLKIIDCDKLSHEVTQLEKRCIADIALEFSIGILNAEGTLNRKKLGAIVFGDPHRLAKLNQIIFPYIKENLNFLIDQLNEQNVPVVILDAPTLFESEVNKLCDYIVSVISPVSVRQSRIVVRDHLTDDEARKRISSQFNDEFYSERSNYTIHNDGDLQDLRIKTIEMIEDMCRHFMKDKNNE